MLLYRCKSETLSTLRFAQRAKAIKNNAVVNEQKEDDVNALHEQIRHLKVLTAKCSSVHIGNTILHNVLLSGSEFHR